MQAAESGLPTGASRRKKCLMGEGSRMDAYPRRERKEWGREYTGGRGGREGGNSHNVAVSLILNHSKRINGSVLCWMATDRAAAGEEWEGDGRTSRPTADQTPYSLQIPFSSTLSNFPHHIIEEVRGGGRRKRPTKEKGRDGWMCDGKGSALSNRQQSIILPPPPPPIVVWGNIHQSSRMNKKAQAKFNLSQKNK